MAIPNNLPAELSSFVGREPQLAELRRLLRQSRLTTLTGPGGAGKTRLAIRLASEVLDRYPDGCWLVELAPLGDAGLLEQTVAGACGAREESGRAMIDVLVERLEGRRALLVLDGCEHLVDSCAGLASRLLRSCPNLTMLVTSRESLGVDGEHTWRTPSLTLPTIEDAGRPEMLLQSEAVRLFAERARLNRPDFELDRSVSEAVAQICTRLEGMPLAIELAAGLDRVMAPIEILERLRDRFRVLTGGSRTSLPRHQTLHQTVDWSFGLISAEEKALLVRLAVFAGGFELAAAEAVAPGGRGDDSGVLPVLSRLVDKSLVIAEPSGSNRTRYRMLDTIREYALEKLTHTAKTSARRRHARYYLDWCRRAAAGARGPDQMNWLERLDDEQANIRLALEWTRAESPDDALKLAAAVFRYWHMRHHVSEGLAWLDQCLGQSTGADARAIGLLARARLRWQHGEYAGAEMDAVECAELCRRRHLKLELTGALTMLGLLAIVEGDWSEAAKFHEEAFQIASLLGDHDRMSISLNNLALVDSAQGEHARAMNRLELSLREMDAVGDRFNIGITLDSLGRVNLKLGAHGTARRYYLEALAIGEEFADPPSVANALEGLALVAIVEKDAARTLQLMSAARGLREESGDKSPPDWVEQVEAGLAAARSTLTAQAAEAAWRQGGAWTLEEAVRQATGAVARPRVDGDSRLTARERQVAALVAEGLTNPEIAARLKMAGRTADAHVEHIRNKLGLRTRAQIAVWAHERLDGR